MGDPPPARDLPSTETCQFLQSRLALFGKVGVFLSLGFYVLMHGFFSRHLWEGFFSSLVSIEALGNLGVAAVAGFLWAATRAGPLGARTLRGLDFASTFLICVLCALLGWYATEIPQLKFGALLAAVNILVVRAVLIPSTTLQTVQSSILSILPVVLPAFLQTGGPAAGALPAARPEDFVVERAIFACWGAVAVASAAAVSHVIYGLQCKVRRAQQLGQYKLEEKIGEGGMGQVYKACHAMLRRPTAVKLLRPERAGRENLARFEREVQLTSRLTHPNTIAIFDYGHTDDGTFYYAMEYLPGVNLEALVRGSGPQPTARVIHVLKQVCGSLAEAHSAGLIHRDIKAANIILCDRGGILDVVKVVDFGLVKDLAQGEDGALTAANTITGTPFYLAPEAIRSPAAADSRSDLYAVGVLGYYLLTGTHPFLGESFVEVCGHHLHTAPERPSLRLGRALPEDLEGVILSCMEKDPARRPQTALEVHDALAACSDGAAWSQAAGRAWRMQNPLAGFEPGPADPASASTAAIPAARMTVRVEERVA